MATETKFTEECGCEYTTYSEKEGSCTFLTKCKCKKHYNEQFIAEWYDGDGNFNREPITPSNIVPLTLTTECYFCKENKECNNKWSDKDTFVCEECYNKNDLGCDDKEKWGLE